MPPWGLNSGRPGHDEQLESASEDRVPKIAKPSGVGCKDRVDEYIGNAFQGGIKIVLFPPYSR